MLPLLVDGGGDQFHVIGVDACTIAAQVVNDKMIGNAAAQPLEAEPVRQDVAAMKIEAAVTEVGPSCPIPAFGGFVYFGPESFG